MMNWTDVTAGVIVENGHVLLARRAPGNHLAAYWEFPGGKLEEGEDERTCLARELAEEFDVQVRIGDLLGENICDYGDRVVRLRVYWARHVIGTFKCMVHDAVEWVRPRDLCGYELADADKPFIPKIIESLPEEAPEKEDL